MTPYLNQDWREFLKDEINADYFLNLQSFLSKEYVHNIIYPSEQLIFEAFNQCALDSVRVVILGQDPYHGPGQANGLCFSVNSNIPIPPSLNNIFNELSTDLKIPKAVNGNLEYWANQGVLLLNATMTVRQSQPGSHKNIGWEKFTDSVIRKLSNSKKGIVFLLWGAFAQAKEDLIDTTKHLVLKSAHPSPLSAYRGFIGCKHFSSANAYLIKSGKKAIDWRLA